MRNQRGGITGLFGLIRESGEFVEADLVDVGVDLRDLFRPRSGMTLRYLLLRIRMLPEDARFRQAGAAQPTKLTADRIRERAAFYQAKTKGAQ